MNQQGPIPQEIRTYLENLMQEAGVANLDQQTKENMIQELFFQLDNYLASVMVDNLQEQDLDAFIKMNQEKRPKEEIEQFIKEKIPNVQSVLTNAFLDFKKMYLENASETPAGDK